MLKRMLTYIRVINIMLLTKKEVIIMEIKFTKDDSIKFIEEYYKKFEQREIKAKIKSQKATFGYGMGAMDTCYTNVVIEEEIEVMGIKTKTIETIPEDNLLGIFKTILEEHGFNVTKAEFDDGVNTSWDGCYMNEHEVSRVYCKGIVLNVKRNAKQKTIGGK